MAQGDLSILYPQATSFLRERILRSVLSQEWGISMEIWQLVLHSSWPLILKQTGRFFFSKCFLLKSAQFS